MTVLIVGAGPAGAYLSILLAKNGMKSILIDRLDDPFNNAYSSAALPISTIDKYSFIKDSVSSYWNNWKITGPDTLEHNFSSDLPLGVVLNFGKFRNDLWCRAKTLGVTLLLGWTVKEINSCNQFTEVILMDKDKISHSHRFNLVVDATGTNRSLINRYNSNENSYYKGSGVEYLIEVDKELYNKWSNHLSFFIGSNWVKYGYGWIFPMSNLRLKVGVCRLPPQNQAFKSSNLIDLSRLIELNNINRYSLINIHGGLVSSTLKREETHFCKRIVGIGDCVSTANLLGGEGIRHALCSAEILADVLLSYFNESKFNNIEDFSKLNIYVKRLRREFGWRWIIANRIGRKTWNSISDNQSDYKIKKLINLLSNKDGNALNELLFDYKFEKFLFKLVPYFIGLK
ncbi:NAD(P)/FAD-dependent oxidoreductase [Prochlorococcus marinus]|uniref:NAD(P)/FAD-dependent oxidoreductase n=1 Tax=Prochlorococcus marinus TaxID=1219 RepID=UPI0022B50232|nr:NAD(P)/FAD-dependent oxidoreductase [Prochlorococcus marinus]